MRAFLPILTTVRRFRGGIPRPRDMEGILVGRAARAAEFHTPGGHGVPLTMHKAFLPSSPKKKKKKKKKKKTKKKKKKPFHEKLFD